MERDNCQHEATRFGHRKPACRPATSASRARSSCRAGLPPQLRQVDKRDVAGQDPYRSVATVTGSSTTPSRKPHNSVNGISRVRSSATFVRLAASETLQGERHLEGSFFGDFRTPRGVRNPSRERNGRFPNVAVRSGQASITQVARIPSDLRFVNAPPPKRRWLQVTAQSRIGPPFGGLR